MSATVVVVLTVAGLVAGLVVGGNDGTAPAQRRDDRRSGAEPEGGDEPGPGTEAAAVVAALTPESTDGFDPVAVEAVRGSGTAILPPGAKVVPVSGSWRGTADTGTLRATVSAPGMADAEFDVFLVRREAGWMVIAAAPSDGGP